MTTIALMVMLWQAISPTAVGAGQKADFYVSPRGSDNNSGAADLPFATLTRAKEAVRALVARGLHKDILVLIRAGTYSQSEPIVFGPEDSGTDKASITYAAVPGNRVILSGGRKISGWKQGQGGIWTTDLEDVKEGKWYFRQLFVNNRRAVRARTPQLSGINSGWWKVKTSTANGTPPARDATMILSVDHPIQAWKNADDVELVFVANNEGSRRRLGEVDAASQTFTIPPPQESIPKIFGQDWRLSVPTAGKGCYLENAREMLDRPGEWYLDRHAGVLSYWPRWDEDMSQVEVVAPLVTKTLVSVAGTSERPVKNLHFDGIHVEHVDWPLPPTGYYGMFGCLLATGGEKPVLKWMDGAVHFAHAESCSFVNGGVEHAGGMGLCVLEGSDHILIEGNDIADLGGGGIAAGALRNRSTLQWVPPPKEGYYTGIRIANNHIHDCGVDYFGGAGIFLAMTRESFISHNLIHDTAYAGIIVSGSEDPASPFARNNTIEYNHIYRVQKTAVDGGGIYASFPQAGWGAVIRGNLIHDIVGNPFARSDPGGWMAPGIYMDGAPNGLGCKKYLIDNNVVYHVSAPLFLLGCNPGDLTFEQNTTLDKGIPDRQVLGAIQAKAGLEAPFRNERSLSQPW